MTNRSATLIAKVILSHKLATATIYAKQNSREARLHGSFVYLTGLPSVTSRSLPRWRGGRTTSGLPKSEVLRQQKSPSAKPRGFSNLTYFETSSFFLVRSRRPIPSQAGRLLQPAWRSGRRLLGNSRSKRDGQRHYRLGRRTCQSQEAQRVLLGTKSDRQVLRSAVVSGSGRRARNLEWKFRRRLI